jgi:hypothetical protein
MVLKSEVNAENKITAAGASDVPVLKYSFGKTNWR